MPNLGTAISEAMAFSHQAKLFIEHAGNFEHGSLHIIVGVLAWLAIALATRRPVSSWIPWLGLFALILWNELVDLWMEKWPEPGMQYGEGMRDVILTMFVPTLIRIAVLVRPSLFRPYSKTKPTDCRR